MSRRREASSWEQRKWSELFDILSNNTLSRDNLNDLSGMACDIHYGDVLVRYSECISVKETHLPYITDPAVALKSLKSELQEGDVIFADTAEDETVGKCVELRNLDKVSVVSGLHTIPCRPRMCFAPGYLGFYLNSNAYHDQLLPLIQGIKVSSISKGAIATSVIRYPSLKEQLAISSFLLAVNQLISLHQRKSK
jgi:type I restriction enzyme S subunit